MPNVTSENISIISASCSPAHTVFHRNHYYCRAHSIIRPRMKSPNRSHEVAPFCNLASKKNKRHVMLSGGGRGAVWVTLGGLCCSKWRCLVRFVQICFWNLWSTGCALLDATLIIPAQEPVPEPQGVWLSPSRQGRVWTLELALPFANSVIWASHSISGS